MPYNPEWPQQFEEEACLIKEALGDNCLAIHHVGSTSVPGLAAKPKIDIIAIIQDPDKTIEFLEQAGFAYKGEWNIPFKYGFTKRGEVFINLHVYEKDHPEIELNLLFRDYLRTHPSARDEYAELKFTLLKDQASFKKKDSLFSGYNLGKNEFIRKTLNQAGFNRLRFMKCTHYAEWDAAKQFRQYYFFDKVPVADPYTWTFNHPDHAHFVLYHGIEIIGYAHLQLWPERRSALRIIVIDEEKRHQGYGSQFLMMIEKWLKAQGYQRLHAESSPAAYAFYQKYSYSEMSFDDPDNHPSYPQDIPMGKIL